MNIDTLINKAKLLRQKTFDAFIEKGEAHLGGSFSMIEALISTGLPSAIHFGRPPSSTAIASWPIMRNSHQTRAAENRPFESYTYMNNPKPIMSSTALRTS